MRSNTTFIRALGYVLLLTISPLTHADDCPPGESYVCPTGQYGACYCKKLRETAEIGLPLKAMIQSHSRLTESQVKAISGTGEQDACASHPEFNVIAQNGSDNQSVSIDQPAVSVNGQCIPLGWGGHLALGKAVIEGVRTDVFCQKHGFSPFGALPDEGITTDWGNGQEVALILDESNTKLASTYGTPDAHESSASWVGIVTNVVCAK